MRRFFFGQERFSQRIDRSEYLCDLNIDSGTTATARDALIAGDFASVEEAFEKVSGVNERVHFIEAMGDWEGRPAFLRDWVSATASVAARSADAINCLKWAWAARGGEGADKVAHSQWEEFRKRLVPAKRLLLQVAKECEGEIAVFPWLLSCCRAHSDKEMEKKVFRTAVRRQPSARAVYSSGILTHSARWFGSKPSCLRFARRCAEVAPPGIGAEIFPLEAHWLIVGDQDEFEFGDYWQQGSVRREVVAIEERVKRASLKGLAALRSAQWLAFSFYFLRELDRSRYWFKAGGSEYLDRPWHDSRVFDMARERLF